MEPRDSIRVAPSVLCPRCKAPFRKEPLYDRPLDDFTQECFLGYALDCPKCGLSSELLCNEEAHRQAIRLREAEFQYLSTLAKGFREQVEITLAEILKRPGFRWPRLTEADECRLLNFRSLMLKHHISLKEILIMVLQRFPPRTGIHAGINIPQLCGVVACRHVEEAVKSKYPNCENVEIWKAEQRRNQLRSNHTPPCHSFDDAQMYQRQLKRLQREARLQGKQLARKPYRNNPWR